MPQQIVHATSITLICGRDDIANPLTIQSIRLLLLFVNDSIKPQYSSTPTMPARCTPSRAAPGATTRPTTTIVILIHIRISHTIVLLLVIPIIIR